MPKVSFVKEKQDVEVPEGATLRTEALKHKIQVNYQLGNGTVGKVLNCHGLGTCGSCLVLVKKGAENLTPRAGWEKFRLGVMMSTIGHEEEARLSCQAKVKGDCTIETNPGINWSGENFWQKPYPNK